MVSCNKSPSEKQVILQTQRDFFSPSSKKTWNRGGKSQTIPASRKVNEKYAMSRGVCVCVVVFLLFWRSANLQLPLFHSVLLHEWFSRVSIVLEFPQWEFDYLCEIVCAFAPHIMTSRIKLWLHCCPCLPHPTHISITIVTHFMLHLNSISAACVVAWPGHACTM